MGVGEGLNLRGGTKSACVFGSGEPDPRGTKSTGTSARTTQSFLRPSPSVSVYPSFSVRQKRVKIVHIKMMYCRYPIVFSHAYDGLNISLYLLSFLLMKLENASNSKVTSRTRMNENEKLIFVITCQVHERKIEEVSVNIKCFITAVCL